ncbi:RAN-specific GTPase activating protein [Spraguea lophii 42_110]|uniref:RAN-specific GTPase activating protein n=1 Tax=Spraguea lophii (strain 42_110) TaxID=1358809 RepID=S7XNZ9_SPRLO|nr:RAN-specific GTPase activating protein [Spraguea lophii 42_110]
MTEEIKKEKNDIMENEEIKNKVNKEEADKNIEQKSQDISDKEDEKKEKDDINKDNKQEDKDIQNNEEKNVETDTKTEKKDDKLSDREELSGNDIFKEKCKLFRFDKKRNKVEQRGIGYIFISFVEEKKMYKITMVRDKIYKLGCNHFIEENMDLTAHQTAENTWMWQTRGDVCDDGIDDPSQTYIVKFNDEENYKDFKDKFEEAKQKNIEIINK